ncbi:MAG: hypothetical protein AB7F75_05785 [Planctomycetota bacterium]
MRLRDLILLMVMGTAIACRHLVDGLWYDEAYTLEFFASSPRKALTDFHLPNNQPLFSFVLSLWQMAFGNSVILLRLLPFFCWLATLALTTRAAFRIGGVRCGFLAGLLLCSTHALVNYSCQLRGYIMATAFLAWALDSAVAYRQAPHRYHGALFLLAQWMGAAVLPTQAIFAAPLVLVALDKPWRHPFRLVLGAAAPVMGLGIYALNPKQFLQVAQTLDVNMTRMALLIDSKDAYLSLWGCGGGLLVSLLAMGWSKRKGGSPSRILWPLFFAMALPLGLAMVMPHTPYARNFLPLLPLLAVFIATPLASWLTGRLPVAIMILMAGASLWNEMRGGGYFERHKLGDKPENLLDLYHHHQFKPYDIAALALQESQDQCVILIDDSDLWALNYAFRFQLGVPSHAAVVYYRKLEQYPHLLEQVRMAGQILVISRHEEGANIMARMCVGFGELPPRIMLLHDTGYFKLWELVRS